MAAPVSRTLVQVVRPHIPRIRFPKRSERGQSGSGSRAEAPPKVVSVKPTISASGGQKPPGQSQRGTGINQTDLPARYRRRPIDQSEMDAIMRGGRD